MSWNISTWKLKKIENLKVPVKEFYVSDRTDWHPDNPEIIEIEENTVEIECGCGQQIRGILKDGILEIKEMEMYGEGSGTFFQYILEHALSKSTGKLEAVAIWEGGESIQKLSVNDGVVEWIDIEL